MWQGPAAVTRLTCWDPTDEGVTRMAVPDYVESLRNKHAQLEQVILEESLRPLPDQALLTQLKKQKLRLKDEIARLTRNGGGVAMPAAAGEVH